MEGTNSQSREQARRAQVPGVLQLNQVHYRPWNFHFFSGTKQTRCKQQLLPRQRLHAEPNYIKASFD